MNQGEGNYQQNFHRQNVGDNYDNGYTNEYGDFVQNYAPLGLEVPNTRLYSENNLPIYEEAHMRNSEYYQQSQPLESDIRCLNPASPTEYYNEAYETNHQNAPPQAAYVQQAKSKFSHIQYDNNQDYQYYPEETSFHNYYDGYHENSEYVNGNCKYCEYKKTYYPELYQRDLLRAQAQDYEYYGEDSTKKYCGYGKKLPKGSKKYPVTVKMSKYVKNANPAMFNKKPSALCLPVVTQPLGKRKSKTNQQIKKTNHPQCDGYYENDPHVRNATYSPHKMHSQGDVKNLDGIENVLDKLQNEPEEAFEGDQQSWVEKNKIKQLTKLLKPRVPSSIRCKQQQQTSETEPKPSYQPRLKVSLDKLLTRLQKCENPEDIVNEFSPRSSKTEILSPKTQTKEADKKKVDSIKSYNYEELSKKCPKKEEDLGVKTVHKATMNQLQSSSESIGNKKIIKSLDDNCALDLHRSKSYIVDLIDKALSKELGTIPRGQSIHHNLSPLQAINTISRHRQSYDLTPKLADSFASAPVEGTSRVAFEKSASDGQIKPNTSDVDCYVKQLKQLRWGHIRHIQHEAKKLADLEEFLENCGEIMD